MKIGIVNYGAGNLFSVKQGLEKAKATVEIILPNSGSLEAFDALVLPGVGAFKPAMETIAPIKDKLKEELEGGKPLLGICLGLQLLFSSSDEGGKTTGLAILLGNIKKLSESVKLPQIGWNTIEIKKQNPLLQGVNDGSYVYFVHSYVCKPNEIGVVISETDYGERFPSVIARRNIYATQFHPEKSGKIGQRILENFVALTRR